MSTTIKFVKSATEGLAISPSKFAGAKIRAAGVMEVHFHKTTGGAAAFSEIELTITDGAAGIEQKRAFQALANALGGHPRHGAVVEVADVLTGKFIHRDITGITAVNL
tara:strand:+ start:123 stop:446 length:324 start_codon:yes stop_codon:yes gene_type:complete